MKFSKTNIEGSYLITQEPHRDERGFFARSYCADEFNKAGLNYKFSQVNNSQTEKKHTLRGLHFQLKPHQEAKLIRCISGIIWDVIVDLRPNSSSFKKWFSTELSAQNRNSLYVPEGCAHGFLSLTDDTEIIYFVSQSYNPYHERTLHWSDPEIDIKWPVNPVIVSHKDANGLSLNLLANELKT